MLYLGEYDITDLNKLVLSLFAPNNAKLSGVELVADYTLQSPPENWKQADVLPSEDSNATVCYVEETLVQISGGQVLCNITDFAEYDQQNQTLSGNSSSWAEARDYTADFDVELTGSHKLYLKVTAAANWTGNLKQVTLKAETVPEVTEIFDPSKVSLVETPEGASINGGILNWDTVIAQGGEHTLTVRTTQEGYCPEREISVKVIDYPVLPELNEIIFQAGHINRFLLRTKNPADTDVTYTGILLPDGMTIKTAEDKVCGLLNWVPTADQKGIYRIGIKAKGLTESPVTYYSVRVTDEDKDITDMDEALAVADNAVVGYQPGEYTFYAMDSFRKTLERLGFEDSAGIAEAVRNFRKAVNTDKTGDVDGDGQITIGDLACVMDAYGTDNMQCDVDGSGVISLEDMVHIAKSIDEGIYRTYILGSDAGLYVTKQNEWRHYVSMLNTSEDTLIHFQLSDIPGEIISARLMLDLAEESPQKEAAVTISYVEDDKTVKMCDSENRSGYRLPEISGYNVTENIENGELTADVTGFVKQEEQGDGELTLHLKTSEDIRFYSDDGGDMATMPRLELVLAVTEETADALDDIEKDFEALGLAYPQKVEGDQNFADAGENGTTFQWKSDDEYVITDVGKVTRAFATLDDSVTNVTVKAVNNSVSVEKKLQIVVAKQPMSEYVSGSQVNPKIEKVILEDRVKELVETYWMDEDDKFTYVNYPEQYLEGLYITVEPGESIGDAVDQVSQAGGGVVILTEGIHELKESVYIRSNVTLVGYGKERTIIRQAKNLSGSMFCTEDVTPCVENFIFKDLSIEGVRGYVNNACGMVFNGGGEKWHNRIMLQNVRLKNCGNMGIHMKRVDDIIMDRSEIVYNGESSGFYHNVYFLYNNNILQSDLDMSGPVLGKGCKYTATVNTIAQRIKMKDGVGNGIQSDYTTDYLMLYKYEIDNFENVAMWFACEKFNDKYSYTEDPQYAPQNVILSECRITNCNNGGIWRVVQNPHILNSYFKNRTHDLELLKCGTVDYTGTEFAGPDGKAIEYDRADLDGYYLTEENDK